MFHHTRLSPPASSAYEAPGRPLTDDVSDPNLIFDLNEKLRAAGIFQWPEVEQFWTAFFQKSKSNAALANIWKPAVQRWQIRYKAAVLAYQQTRDLLERAKKTKDAVLVADAEKNYKDAKKEKDALEIFKKDLGTFVRFYEFMSQIVDYDDADLEKLSLYARNLAPLLREQTVDDDDMDLNHVVLSHYRLSKIKQQDLMLEEEQAPYGLKPGEGLGSARARDRKEEFLSQIIARLNEIFVTDHLTDGDQVSYAYAVRDKVRENGKVMDQLANNTDDQALLGDFPNAVEDAIIESGDAFENQKLQLLSDPKKAKAFAKLVFDLLKRAS